MKRIRDISIGFLICFIIMTTTPVSADSIIQKIDVVMNSVQVKINGENLDSSSILYEGSTYLPMRTVVEAVGKDIEWNQSTMTANIVEKVKEGDSLTSNVDNTEEFEVVIENDSTIHFGKMGVENYYSLSYLMKLMNEHAFYGTDSDKLANDKIISIYNDKKEIIIENVPYIEQKGIMFISKTYYENTILPLIN